jgi:glutamine amidotransferase
MKRHVVIIDYQLGNLFSVRQACEQLGCDVTVSSSPEVLLDADFAILPGVGAFSNAMDNMRSFGLTGAVHEYVSSGKPLMGLCLGMQLLFSHSEEFGHTEGLGLIPGAVRKFDFSGPDGRAYKVPQIQWNRIEPSRSWEGTPLQCTASGDFMYFVHSFYVLPEDPSHILSRTTYGGMDYCSAVLHGNVFATQFHPEKSGLRGVGIYDQWLSLNTIKTG